MAMKIPEKTEKLLMSFSNAILEMFEPYSPKEQQAKFEAILSTLRTTYQLRRVDEIQERADELTQESGGQK